MMKKVIVALIIIFVLIAVLLGGTLAEVKKNKEAEIDRIDQSITAICCGEALNDIVQDDITISNITITNAAYLSFHIESTSTDLLTRSVCIKMINSDSNTSELTYIFELGDFMDENNDVVYGIDTNYNNPTEIEIVVE